MDRLIFIALFLSCIACQKQSQTVIDSRFKPAVIEFEALYGRALPPIYITFNELNGIKGKCRVKKNPVTGEILGRSIYIDHGWIDFSPIIQRAVIFHELGHCVLLRNLRPSPHEPGGAMTYMAEWWGEPEELDDINWLSINRQSLDHELFNY